MYPWSMVIVINRLSVKNRSMIAIKNYRTISENIVQNFHWIMSKRVKTKQCLNKTIPLSHKSTFPSYLSINAVLLVIFRNTTNIYKDSFKKLFDLQVLVHSYHQTWNELHCFKSMQLVLLKFIVTGAMIYFIKSIWTNENDIFITENLYQILHLLIGHSLIEIKSNQIKSNQIKSNQIK